MEENLATSSTATAIARLLDAMAALAPSMTGAASAWMNGLAKTGVAADYFQHPLAFPILLLPRWVEEAISPNVDESFQADLTYSSVSGYYFIRMIDNVMDEQSALEMRLLPMTGFFHAEATAIYQHYFEASHPFWNYFSRFNAQSAALAIADGISEHIRLADFQHIAGKKVVGGKIPIAAVLAQYQHLDALPAWEHFYDKLSCWHQMFNDILSWRKDIEHQSSSYFLSEGERRKAANESLFAWLVREGFTWGLSLLQTWLEDLISLAENLGSVNLQRYLQQREALLAAQAKELALLGTMSELIKLGKN
jgi:hypothetical protein